MFTGIYTLYIHRACCQSISCRKKKTQEPCNETLQCHVPRATLSPLQHQSVGSSGGNVLCLFVPIMLPELLPLSVPYNINNAPRLKRKHE